MTVDGGARALIGTLEVVGSWTIDEDGARVWGPAWRGDQPKIGAVDTITLQQRDGDGWHTVRRAVCRVVGMSYRSWSDKDPGGMSLTVGWA